MAASMELVTDEKMERKVLEPLLLADTSESIGACESGEGSKRLPCLFCDCDVMFDAPDGKDQLLKHLLTSHKFVIADVNLICNFSRYILYWKKRLKEQPVTDFCSVINTNTLPTDTGPKEQYYLLSDVLPEDKHLRVFLQKRNLERILDAQQKEREDEGFSRVCLFCKSRFDGNRSEMLNHMAREHSFNIGHADNLVFTDEFLDILKDKLDKLQCLYCEKTFKDRPVLREHMRKKQHRKINPKNKLYDKYYIINYLEMGKNWESLQHERDVVIDNQTDDEHDDWEGWEEEAGSQAICLFCPFSSSNADRLRLHMQELHEFDLDEIKKKFNLNYYQQVKLINYIRRQIHIWKCIGCQNKFASKEELLDHMHAENHTNIIPDSSTWDQPQYYFPTYENDNLLCQLEDNSDEDSTSVDSGYHASHGVNIIAEDNKICDSILTDNSLREELLQS